MTNLDCEHRWLICDNDNGLLLLDCSVLTINNVYLLIITVQIWKNETAYIVVVLANLLFVNSVTNPVNIALYFAGILDPILSANIIGVMNIFCGRP